MNCATTVLALSRLPTTKWSCTTSTPSAGSTPSTSTGAVVFYDYDELALLEDVNFREMPVSQNYDDEMSDQPWFPVEPHDVFPEEFKTYLRSPRVVGEVMESRHPELCTVEFWKSMQALHAAGELPDFYPYPDELRFSLAD